MTDFKDRFNQKIPLFAFLFLFWYFFFGQQMVHCGITSINEVEGIGNEDSFSLYNRCSLYQVATDNYHAPLNTLDLVAGWIAAIIGMFGFLFFFSKWWKHKFFLSGLVSLAVVVGLLTILLSPLSALGGLGALSGGPSPVTDLTYEILPVDGIIPVNYNKNLISWSPFATALNLILSYVNLLLLMGLVISAGWLTSDIRNFFGKK
jgi:hypothetical protein